MSELELPSGIKGAGLKSAAKYRRLLEAVPALVISMNELGACVYVSPRAARLLGLERAELEAQQARAWLEHVHPEDRGRLVTAVGALVRRGVALSLRLRVRSGEGRYVELLARASPAQVLEGRRVYTGLLSPAEESAASDAEQEPREVTLRLDAEGRCVGASGLVSQLLGVSDERLAREGLTVLFDRLHAEDQPRFFGALGQLSEGASFAPLRLRVRGASGRWGLMWLSGGLPAEVGRQVAFSITFAEAEEPSLAAEPSGTRGPAPAPEWSAELDVLLAGTIHEVNNPLTFVMANTDFVLGELGQLARRLAPEPACQLQEVVEALRASRRGAERIKAAMRDLREFLLLRQAGVTAMELGELLLACVRVASPALSDRVVLAPSVTPGAFVKSDVGVLAQIITAVLLECGRAFEHSHRMDRLVVAASAEDGRGVIEVDVQTPAETLLEEPIQWASSARLSACGARLEELGGSLVLGSRGGADGARAGGEAQLRLLLPRA